jgi:hypothetical protein
MDSLRLGRFPHALLNMGTVLPEEATSMSANTTNTTVNGQTVVHKDSGGIVTTSPDVCMTPMGNSTVPIPYTNVAKSVDTSNGSVTVTVNGNPKVPSSVSAAATSQV